MSDESLIDLFHKIKKIIPKTQKLITLPAETPITEAIKIMDENNFNQIPVVQNKSVLGVFTYRSFSNNLIKYQNNIRDISSLTIEDFTEEFNFMTINEELTDLITELDIKDAVLVGNQDRLQGIVTTIDALQYFIEVANPYIMFGEIELGIRALIHSSVSEEELFECVKKSLSYKYDESSIPKKIEEMTLTDYVSIIRYGETYCYFEKAFGRNHNIVKTKLSNLPDLRNDLFHFKRDIRVNEYNDLKKTRNWILQRVRKYEADNR